jgi:hypothetical protein
VPLLVGFAALLGAVLLLSKGVTDASFADILKGNAGRIYRSNQTKLASSSSSAAAGGSAGGVLGAIANAAGQVNPVPGATGNRLDAGFDVTGKQFLSPFAGKVIVSNPSDPGWQGGGYIAIQSLANPKQVVYFAEGLVPIVGLHQIVQAGESFAHPVINPYNGSVGSIEFGPADASGQPLAHSSHDPKGVVMAFYNWVRSLGGPAATSTSNAGYA